jgi:hypothetical protein
MSQIANDGTLVRGSEDITINSVTYTLTDFKRDGAKSRSEIDYGSDGKPQAASHAEDPEMFTGTIRCRSDKVDPPKFIVFSFDSKNWYIKEREKSGSAPGLKEFSVEIWECLTGSVTVT